MMPQQPHQQIAAQHETYTSTVATQGGSTSPLQLPHPPQPLPLASAPQAQAPSGLALPSSSSMHPTGALPLPLSPGLPPASHTYPLTAAHLVHAFAPLLRGEVPAHAPQSGLGGNSALSVLLSRIGSIIMGAAAPTTPPPSDPAIAISTALAMLPQAVAAGHVSPGAAALLMQSLQQYIPLGLGALDSAAPSTAPPPAVASAHCAAPATTTNANTPRASGDAAFPINLPPWALPPSSEASRAAPAGGTALPAQQPAAPFGALSAPLPAHLGGPMESQLLPASAAVPIDRAQIARHAAAPADAAPLPHVQPSAYVHAPPAVSSGGTMLAPTLPRARTPPSSVDGLLLLSAIADVQRQEDEEMPPAPPPPLPPPPPPVQQQQLPLQAPSAAPSLPFLPLQQQLSLPAASLQPPQPPQQSQESQQPQQPQQPHLPQPSLSPQMQPQPQSMPQPPPVQTEQWPSASPEMQVQTGLQVQPPPLQLSPSQSPQRQRSPEDHQPQHSPLPPPPSPPTRHAPGLMGPQPEGAASPQGAANSAAPLCIETTMCMETRRTLSSEPAGARSVSSLNSADSSSATLSAAPEKTGSWVWLPMVNRRQQRTASSASLSEHPSANDSLSDHPSSDHLASDHPSSDTTFRNGSESAGSDSPRAVDVGDSVHHVELLPIARDAAPAVAAAADPTHVQVA